jgi:hypothetical protein
VKDLAAKLTSGITEPEEKVKAIYNWVSQSVVWSGNNRRYPDKKMDEVIDQKEGNSADINMLLVSLLRSAGITSDPFILSTRANGKVQDLYPISSQFNYVVAKAKAGTKDIYLDATDPLRPYDLLPLKVLYTKALAIKEGPVEWVTLGCEKKNNTSNIIWMNLDEEGKMNGYFENIYGEYQSLRIRKDLKDGNEKEIVKKLLETEQYGLEIDSIVVLNKDSISSPLKIKAYVSSDTYAQLSGDNIYLNPNFIFREKENPFKSEIRKFPVNYSYQSCTNNIFTINFPQGYEIKEPIKNKNFFAGAANINYNRKCAQEGNQLQMITKFDIKDIEVKPALYEKLRDFYSRVVAAQSEQIVLAKKNIQ